MSCKRLYKSACMTAYLFTGRSRLLQAVYVCLHERLIGRIIQQLRIVAL